MRRLSSFLCPECSETLLYIMPWRSSLFDGALYYCPDCKIEWVRRRQKPKVVPYEEEIASQD